MTRDEAEQIVIANEVGMFRGSRSELVTAMLTLSAYASQNIDRTELVEFLTKSDSENKPNKL